MPFPTGQKLRGGLWCQGEAQRKPRPSQPRAVAQMSPSAVTLLPRPWPHASSAPPSPRLSSVRWHGDHERPEGWRGGGPRACARA